MTRRRFVAAPEQPEVAARTSTEPRFQATTKTRKVWAAGPVLDQGQTPECAAFAWVGLLMSGPSPSTATKRQATAYAHGFHQEAIKGGETPDVAVRRGLIREWVQPTSLDDLANAILTTGPAVICIPWHRSMYRTNGAGKVTVKIDSSPGYHFILVCGYNTNARLDDGQAPGPAFLVRNSWGNSWGSYPRGWRRFTRRRLIRSARTGDGWIRVADLQRLIDSSPVKFQGAAVVPLGRSPRNLT